MSENTKTRWFAMTDEERKEKSEKAKVRRAEYKRNHQCTCCGKQDERTLEGRVLCEFCNNKRIQAQHKWAKTEKGKRVISRRNKKYYAKRKVEKCSG